MQGLHLSEYIKSGPSQKHLNQIGQALWDFYMFQIHHLKKVHAESTSRQFFSIKPT